MILNIRISEIHGMVAMIAACATLAQGQATFMEDFESLNSSPQGFEPQILIDQGWIFRNQAEPQAGASWSPGDEFGTQAFDGSGYLISSGSATDFFGGAISSWAILPEINGQQAGDIFTVWIAGGGAFNYPTYFDVRYAPAGANTGTLADHVGDFTQVLYTAELPIAESGYQRVEVVVPGNGRLAMRFHAPFIRTFAGGGATIAIDTVSVGSVADDPCGIPIPDPGETVIWRAANSPYTLCQDITIPEGGRVEIEPGTTIDLSGGKLRIEGELFGNADGGSPIIVNGSPGFSTELSAAVRGEIELRNAEINTRMSIAGTYASIRIFDSSMGSLTEMTGVGGYVEIDGCNFDAGNLGGFGGLAGSIKLTNSTFINGGSAGIAGLVHVDNIAIDGGQLNIAGESQAHPVLINNVSVTNNTTGSGIRISGPNFLLGNNVTIADNLYPLEMDFSAAGLLHGSMLPVSGNINNYIPVSHLGLAQHRQWANTGIPYVVGGFPQIHGGSLEVEPGTNIKFLPDAGAFIVGDAAINLRGTRDKPILLESFNPSQRWFGLKWVDNFDARARHTIFDGGQITVQSDGGVMDLIHSTVRNSLEGTASVTGGIVRLFGTKIIDNNIGMVTTTSGRIEADGFITPSILEGNTVAVEYNNNNGIPFMRNNWWGDPTGPTNPLHPNGMGDTVIDVHPAGFTPYLTATPVLNDEYPIIDMEPTYFTMLAGDKAILRWSSTDDDEIVEHRVQFADHDFPNEFQTIAVLGGDEYTYEFTAPSVLPNNLYPTPSAIRIVAIDSVGQESWDKSQIRIPYQEDWTVVSQDVQLPTTLVRPHENIDVCWLPGGSASVHVILDGINILDAAGGAGSCLAIGATLPYSSTDTARLVVTTTFGAGGRLNYSFSDYFTIRPDERIGDEPPRIEVTSPVADDEFISEGLIPIRWEASDDESLRSFNIQASYDGGRTWPSVIRDLPGDTRSFDWPLPVSSGIDDVRVRVIAFDHRFQDSSFTTRAFSILSENPCPADLTGDGELNFFDISAFINAFSLNDLLADFTGDGQLNYFDISRFLTEFGMGCP